MSRKPVLAVLLLALTEAVAAAPAAPLRAETRVVEPIAYEQLGAKLGHEVVVFTRLGTRRRGTVVKVSPSALILKLDARSGGIELDMPRDTIRSVELVGAPQPAEEDTGAKKN